MNSIRRSRLWVLPWMSGLTYWTTRGFWAVVDQALFAVSNLVINVLLARWLSPREYGAFVTAYVVLILIGVAHQSLLIEPMMVLGPSRYAGRFNQYLPILLRFQNAFGVAAAACLLIVSAVAYALGEGLLAATFVGLACAAPCVYLSWLVRRACYIERKPFLAAVGGVVYLLFAGLGSVVLYNAGLLTSVAAQLLIGVAGLASSGVILRQLRQPFSQQAKPIPQHATPIDERLLWRDHWEFFRWGGASGLLVFSQGLIFYLLLPLFGGLEATAALRAMTNFVMPVLQSDSALVTLMVPELARHRRNPVDLSRIIRWSKRLFGLEGLIYWALIAIFRTELVRFAYGDRYVAYADLLLVLGALPLVSSRVNILAALLRVHQQVRQVFWASAAAAGASLAVGLTSMAAIGVYGAVIGMLVADIVRIAVLSRFAGLPNTVTDDVDEQTGAGASQPPRILEVRQ